MCYIFKLLIIYYQKYYIFPKKILNYIFNCLFIFKGINNNAQPRIKVMVINFGSLKMAIQKMQILVVQCLNQ